MATFNPVEFPGDDTEKLQRAAHAAAAHPGSTLRIPWIGRPWRLSDTVTLANPGQYVQCNIVGDPIWNLIEFRPSPLPPARLGARRRQRAAFRIEGLKHGRIEHVRILTYGDATAGWHFAVRHPIYSASNFLVQQCRVQIMGGKDCDGFVIGETDDPHAHNDFCHATFRSCMVCRYYDDHLAEDRLLRAAQDRNCGYRAIGGNTLGIRYDDCDATGLQVGWSQFPSPLHVQTGSGGRGWLLTHCNSSHVALPIQMDSGFQGTILHGRHEHCGSVFSHGKDTSGYGQVHVHVTLTGIQFDAANPHLASVCGLFTPGALFSFRSASQYDLNGLSGTQRIDDEPIGHGAVYCAHYNANKTAVIRVGPSSQTGIDWARHVKVEGPGKWALPATADPI